MLRFGSLWHSLDVVIVLTALKFFLFFFKSLKILNGCIEIGAITNGKTNTNINCMPVLSMEDWDWNVCLDNVCFGARTPFSSLIVSQASPSPSASSSVFLSSAGEDFSCLLFGKVSLGIEIFDLRGNDLILIGKCTYCKCTSLKVAIYLQNTCLCVPIRLLVLSFCCSLFLTCTLLN